jgi:hypothetical protein
MARPSPSPARDGRRLGASKTSSTPCHQIRAFLLERGIAVRQGLRFLRAELPTILATRGDVLSPRMLRFSTKLDPANW